MSKVSEGKKHDSGLRSGLLLVLIAASVADLGCTASESSDAGPDARPGDAGGDAAPDAGEADAASDDPLCSACCAYAMDCGWHTDEPQCVTDCAAFRAVVPEAAFIAAVSYEGFGCFDEPHACNVRDCAEFCDHDPQPCNPPKGDCVDVCVDRKRLGTEICHVERSAMFECFLEEPGACELSGKEGAPCAEEVGALSVCTND